MSELTGTELELPDAPPPGDPFLLLHAGRGTFAVPLPDVAEVLPATPCTPLPGAPASVEGLLNLRGRIVTVIDLARMMGDAPAAAREGIPDRRIGVLERDGRRIGVLVDRSTRIALVDPRAFVPARDRPGVHARTQTDGLELAVIDTAALIAAVLATSGT